MTNKDKIITSISIIGILVMTCYLQSCTTNRQVYNNKFHKNYVDKCPTFKNKVHSWDI